MEELTDQGFLLKDALEAVGLAKSTWYDRLNRTGEPNPEGDRQKQVIREIVADHPDYGYRRIQPEYEARTGTVINHKPLLDRLNEMDLALRREVNKPRRSGVQRVLNHHRGHLNLVTGWEPGPLECLSTDFTEIQYAGGTRKAWLMAYLDVNSGWMPGWGLGGSANRELAARAFESTVSAYEAHGGDIAGTVIHSDQDPVYKSYDYLRRLMTDHGCVVSFSENGCRDNPWIESRWGRLKTECGSLLIEAETESELREVIDEQHRYYNHDRRHSSIDYMTPIQYLESVGISAGGITIKRGQKSPV